MSTATDTENQITDEINSKKTLLPVLVSQAVMIIFYKIMLTDIKLYTTFNNISLYFNVIIASTIACIINFAIINTLKNNAGDFTVKAVKFLINVSTLLLIADACLSFVSHSISFYYGLLQAFTFVTMIFAATGIAKLCIEESSQN